MQIRLFLKTGYLDILRKQYDFLIDYFHGRIIKSTDSNRWYCSGNLLPTEISVNFVWKFQTRIGHATYILQPCYDYGLFLKYITKFSIKRRADFESIQNNNMLSHCRNFDVCKKYSAPFVNPLLFKFIEMTSFSPTQIEVHLSIYNIFYDDLQFELEMFNDKSDIFWIGQLKFKGTIFPLQSTTIKCYFGKRKDVHEYVKKKKLLCFLRCKSNIEIELWKGKLVLPSINMA